MSNFFDSGEQAANEVAPPPPPAVVASRVAAPVAPMIAPPHHPILPPVLPDVDIPIGPPIVEIKDKKKGQNVKATLQSVSLQARVQDLTVDATIEMKFRNHHNAPIEATFLYRSSASTSIYSLAVDIGGKTLHAKVKGKEAALDAYDDAISAGGRGFLLEHSDHDDAFSLALGNLGPGMECVVRMSYVEDVGLDDEGNAMLEFPITAIVPPEQEGANKNNNISFQVDIVGSDIKSVDCISQHDVVVTKPEKDITRVVKSDAPMKLMRELKLKVIFDEAGLPFPRVESDGPGSTVVSISFVPRIRLDDLKDEEVMTEVVFVVDRSGSMAGSRLRQTKSALQNLLRSLPQGCLFDIVSFGDRYERLFGKSVVYDASSFDRASRAVNVMEANMGGTNILAPLQSVFSDPVKEYPRQVIVLTDGEVPNVDEVVAATKNAAQTSSTRVFSLGIGSDASPRLIHGIAKAGKGTSELVASGERIEPVVARMVQRVLRPIIKEVAMDWRDLKDKARFVTPLDTPVIFSGQKFTAYAVLFESDAKKHSVALTMKLTGGQTRSYVAEVDLATVSPGLTAHRMATKSIINDFVAGRVKDFPKKDIVALAVKYGIASKLTSLVIADTDDVQVSESAMLSVDGADETRNAHGKALKDKDVDALFAAPARPIAKANAAGGDLDDMLGDIGEVQRSYELSALATQSERLEEASVAFSAGASKQKSRTSGGLLDSISGWFKSGSSSSSSASASVPAPVVAADTSKAPRRSPSPTKNASIKRVPQAPSPAGPPPPASFAAGRGVSYGGAPPAAPAFAAGAAPPPPPPASVDYCFSAESAPQQQQQQLQQQFFSSSSFEGFTYQPEAQVLAKSIMSKRDAVAVHDDEDEGDDGAWSEEKEVEHKREREEMRRNEVEEEERKPRLSSSSSRKKSEKASEAPAVKIDPNARPLDKLTMLQSFQGNWTLNASFALAIGVSEKDLAAPNQFNADVWATAIALVVLEIRFAELRVEWDLLAKKARKWIVSNGVDLEKVLSSARGVIKN